MNNKRIHIDYAYTLQGWLKDINGYRVDTNSTGVYDIGEDGSNTNYVNKRFGRDLFSSMIQFYQTDYSPISGNNYFNLVSTNSIGMYNGNISAISVGIKNLDPLLKSYCYDKINRIKEMKSAGLNNNVWGTLSNLFGSTYSYDFNGNIDTLIRYDQNGNLLHNIRYTYSADRNRLSGINVTGTGIGSSSYQYDALGNLIRDNNENINVTWNVIGKVKSVQTPNNMLSFAYNPFGQRQIKRTASDSTYYIHDATGNVMSIYVKDYPKIIAKERPIYGSSRLGIMNKEVEFNLTGNLLSKSNSTIGIKEYELCDHLSNVSVVVLDRKDCYNSVFKPIVKTYTDYYPFGYPISSRTDNVDYRYGFNGQEGDDEIYNAYRSYLNFGNMGYDTRIVRRWRTDPYSQFYPDFSPYIVFANNPIYFRDLDGNILRDQNGNIIYSKDGNSFWVVAFGQKLQVQNVFIYTDEGKKVSVQMITDLQDIVTGNSVKNGTTKNTYICHGFSMLDGKFIPNSEYSVSNTLVLDKMGRSDLTPEEVKDNLKTDFSQIKNGDILVFYDNVFNKETGKMEEGVVTHTAVWSESEKKYISKNGYNEIGMYSLNELKKIYGNNAGYFTPKEDKKVNVEGTKGPVYGTIDVRSEDVNKLIEQ